MTKTKLTPRQAKFVEGLLLGLGKREAAVAAGYLPAGAHVSASRLLNNEIVLRHLREGAEKRLHGGAVIAANVLLELAEKAKSEAVRADCAKALLSYSGIIAVQKHETRHVIEDRRSDKELEAHVLQLARQLNIRLPANIIDVPSTPVALPAPSAEPAASPVVSDDPFEGLD
jgi:phage terminase small subunit